MEIKANRAYRALKPSLQRQRGEAHLLVWGELAQWMVVDPELRSFLRLFDGKRTLKQVLRRHARRQRRPLEAVQPGAAALVEDLAGRGILYRGARPAPPAPEPVGIANVTINLTNRCNLRCRWCYNDEGRGGREAPIQQLMDAVERGRGVLADDASFIILGGEPTLKMDRLLHAVDRAGELFGPRTLVSTNGTLLSDRVVERLARRRLEVQVSVDSHLAPRHDAVRGEGVFHEALAGVRRLVRAEVPVILCMVYDRDGVDGFEPYLDLARSLGVREARFIPMRLMGRGQQHAARAPDQAAAFEHLLDVLARRPELRSLLLRDYFSIFTTIFRFSSPRTGCGVGRKVVFIDADGAVYPCPNHTRPEHICGNVLETGLEELVRSSPVMRAMRRQYVVDRYTRCKGCPFRYWCAGDCRGEVLVASGDGAEPSPHCDELRQVYERLLWLLADGDERLGATERLHHGQRVPDTFKV